MHLLKSLAVSLALLAAGLAPQAASAQTAPSVYWGAYVEGAPFDAAKLNQFETDAGKRQSIVFWGQPWSMNGSMQRFQTQSYEAVRLRGSIPLVGWTSQALGAGTLQSSYALARIYNGAYDGYITQWAQDARAWGHPFFIRFDHEMNGWWYPWSEQINGNRPGDYVKAWRHVVDIFRSVGATNATWVWASNTTGGAATPLPGLYPGDNYVDWTAMNGYNWGTDHGFSWFWIGQIFGVHPWTGRSTYQDILAVAPTKPIMIAETATSKNGGDPGAWIRDALLTQIPQTFPQVKALVWFNWNAGDPTLSWPIESTAAQQTAFKNSIASSYYASNTFASLPGGPVKPLAGPAPPAQPQGVTTKRSFADVADTWVNAAQPASTAGDASMVLIAGDAPSRIAYLRFDLSSLAGKTITSAQLWIHTAADYGSVSNASFAIDYVPDNSWNQYTSYNTAPSTSTPPLGTLAAPDQALTWYYPSLTASGVQSHVGGVLSLAVKSTGSGDGVIFHSRESGPGSSPQLVITYR